MDASEGTFNFNSNHELCIGEVGLSEFTTKHLAKPNEASSDAQTEAKFCTPLFLYSKNKLVSNFLAYKRSFEDEISSSREHNIQTFVSYSLKANFNPSILKVFQANGSWCSLVNKNELLLALKCGFRGENLIFNGNGKTLEEIELAVQNACFLNIDSLFNLKHTIQVCQKLDKLKLLSVPAKIVIRINQLINARVHQYLSTSVDSCKFGIVAERELDAVMEIVKENPKLVVLVGFHTHLGSTVKDLNLYDESVRHLISVMKLARHKHKVETINFLNFGGGLGKKYQTKINKFPL